MIGLSQRREPLRSQYSSDSGECRPLSRVKSQTKPRCTGAPYIQPAIQYFLILWCLWFEVPLVPLVAVVADFTDFTSECCRLRREEAPVSPFQRSRDRDRQAARRADSGLARTRQAPAECGTLTAAIATLHDVYSLTVGADHHCWHRGETSVASVPARCAASPLGGICRCGRICIS